MSDRILQQAQRAVARAEESKERIGELRASGQHEKVPAAKLWYYVWRETARRYYRKLQEGFLTGLS